ncbi:hypothetical protein NQ042_10600 [Corynebacterium phoceense]|uniref:hypothetical protein n=1 Tax=Corynebacterium phoceense TaxID=1686286 RepID=UPI00211C15D5|nr:hypothetical protein [Corynebacterium phoceense]MCQ9334514.1 hypothetical protein [Corynebacterium phoceense]
MQDWLDALDEKDKATNSKPELRALSDADHGDRGFVPVGADADKVANTGTRPSVEREASSQKRSGWVPLALAAGTFVLIGGAAVAFLSQSSVMSSDEEQPAPEPVAESTSTTVSASAVEGPQAVSASGETSLETGSLCATDDGEAISSENSPRTAIAAFEKAYFATDADGVKKALTKASEMQKQDWAKILPDAAPKGTEYCLKMKPSKGEKTSVELEVQTPGEETSTVYKQLVTAKETAGTWAVDSIEKED